MIRKILLLSLLIVLAARAEQTSPGLDPIHRIRLAEAFQLADSIGNRIWQGWDQAPFAVLLVASDFEYLIRHPQPSGSFQELGEDPLLKSKVFYRARSQPTNFQATFPLDGVPTIVIGQAENTAAKTSSRWVVTLLHEHFHQLQYSQPDYFQAVNSLDLSGGDQTGMWMLQYPFPYRQLQVLQQFRVLTELLVQNFRDNRNVSGYLNEREKFRKLLSRNDYKYFSFQLWQEGISRYTESKVARFAANGYTPTADFRALKDYTTYDSVASAIDSSVWEELQKLDLKADQRLLFYPFGAAEGFLLDKVNPDWRKRYFEDKFYLEKYFQVQQERATEVLKHGFLPLMKGESKRGLKDNLSLTLSLYKEGVNWLKP